MEGHSAGGRSIQEMLWEELDARMHLLGDTGVRHPEQIQGEARGLALSIAVMRNPYAPDPAGVKAEAKQRWKDSRDR